MKAGNDVYIQRQQKDLAWLFLQARSSVLLQVKITLHGHKVECHVARELYNLTAGFHVSHCV